ncbi:MAG: 50S ribosomal protein L6 [Cytophagales bacterium]|nr:MAG: 50S ribosomal protein L6 [Cytophagales bacterium]TAF62452.1 MAG: 50S ribosomal protein L6 [Cytophagales bacterium]
MSRIGKKPVVLPSNIKLEVSDKNVITVQGPKGTLTQTVDPDIQLTTEDGQITVDRPTNQKRHKAMHGLYRALVANMIEGVTNGYTIKLELVGVGYKADVNGQVLQMSLGYSHSIYMQIPSEIKVSAETLKGKNPIVTLVGIDKQLIGHIAAKIRSLRKVEPYKGKGVRFEGEAIRRKAGKAAGKSKK